MAQSPSSARLRLENQVAVVSGGARGIGAGIVRRFVEEGARVVFSDLLNEKGKALNEELGKKRGVLQGGRYKSLRHRGAHEISRGTFRQT